LIGIKGCALTALANLLYEKGHMVRGCDVDLDFYTKSKLSQFKIDTFEEVVLKEKYFYIIGNAFINHDLVNKIKELNYHYLYYPEFISKYFKYHKQLCVSGTHGKTTTTTMLKCIIGNCNYIIGDGSGGYSSNDLIVMEACEYKNTFLNYNPYIGLVLNIDYDHPDYFKSTEDYLNSFRKFIKKSMIVVANGDDNNVRRLNLDEIVTYGIENNNDYVFSVREGKNKTLVIINNQRFIIPLVGIHYSYDFVGAYICAKLINVSDVDIRKRLKNFKLPNRRLEERNINDIIYVCDYAHHPTEIKALYNTLKTKYKDYKLVCFFQPHTISRSIALSYEFKESLSLYDETYIVKTFSSIREVYDKEKEDAVINYWNYPQIDEFCLSNFIFSKKSVYIFVGAGDIDKLFIKIINN
jgi:UDP-N-acetylmuramate--alanine ligase